MGFSGFGRNRKPTSNNPNPNQSEEGSSGQSNCNQNPSDQNASNQNPSNQSILNQSTVNQSNTVDGNKRRKPNSGAPIQVQTKSLQEITGTPSSAAMTREEYYNKKREAAWAKVTAERESFTIQEASADPPTAAALAPRAPRKRKTNPGQSRFSMNKNQSDITNNPSTIDAASAEEGSLTFLSSHASNFQSSGAGRRKNMHSDFTPNDSTTTSASQSPVKSSATSDREGTDRAQQGAPARKWREVLDPEAFKLRLAKKELKKTQRVKAAAQPVADIPLTISYDPQEKQGDSMISGDQQSKQKAARTQPQRPEAAREETIPPMLLSTAGLSMGMEAPAPMDLLEIEIMDSSVMIENPTNAEDIVNEVPEPRDLEVHDGFSLETVEIPASPSPAPTTQERPSWECDSPPWVDHFERAGFEGFYVTRNMDPVEPEVVPHRPTAYEIDPEAYESATYSWERRLTEACRGMSRLGQSPTPVSTTLNSPVDQTTEDTDWFFDHTALDVSSGLHQAVTETVSSRPQVDLEEGEIYEENSPHSLENPDE